MLPRRLFHLIGVVLLLLALTGTGVKPASALVITFTVNSLSDFADVLPGDGKCRTAFVYGSVCTLRAAIMESNALPGANAVKFNLSGTPPHVIQLATIPLPPISQKLSINAATQPGCTAPCVTLRGSASLSPGADGFTITGNESLVRGFTITLFSDQAFGILVTGDRNKVQGNHIMGNDGGIYIGGSNNVVGGTTAAARNVFAGNISNAILVTGGGSLVEGNIIRGNFIGTDPTGNSGVANGGWGIRVDGWVRETIIGGTEAGAGNVIAYNSLGGIYLAGEGEVTAYNKIQGNFIGTNRARTIPLANQGPGIFISAKARFTTVGGSTSTARNFIYANDGHGIRLAGDHAIIQGNLIGGTGWRGNFSEGIYITGPVAGLNVIKRNKISYNTGGIADISQGPNAFRANSIFSNYGPGIDLGDNGVTYNDALDADTGPNGLQNYPSILSASSSTQVIRAALHSKPGSTFVIDFFSSPAGTCDPTNLGEGKKYLGSKKVTTDVNGDVSVNFTSPRFFAKGSIITGTATYLNQATSEFGVCFMAN